MNKELDFLIDIVKKAENIANESFSIERKGGENDLITNLDVKIEKFLINEIKKAYPKFDIVSEEENYNKVPTDNCFIIDPIDGTKNFANNVPLWAIQVAFRKKGKTVAAVINMPRTNELYFADATGAYLNGNKIHVSQVPIKNAIYAIDGNNVLSSVTRMQRHSRSFRRFGAVGVSMAFVAAGRTHGAVFRSDKPWDYESGLFLVKMAGGVIANEPGFHAGAMNKEFLDILKFETAKQVDKNNVFILHSLNGDTLEFWGQDVKAFLSEREVDCYMPEFPIRAESRYEKFNEILSTYLNTGILNKKSVVVCHSIGTAYFIRFCREHNFIPNNLIAVAPGQIYDYPITRDDYTRVVKPLAYLKEEDFKFGKKIKNIYCIYSDQPDGNSDKFTRFVADFNAKAIYYKGYSHFDGYHRIYKIPELLQLLNKLI